eukprot:3065958-Amphidinium_carterae.1
MEVTQVRSLRDEINVENYHEKYDYKYDVDCYAAAKDHSHDPVNNLEKYVDNIYENNTNDEHKLIDN